MTPQGQPTRRAALKGLGTAIALPYLESLVPAAPAAVSPAASRPPLRMLFLYVPNGVHMPAWRPAKEGAGFDLPATLKPLQPHRDDLTLFTGLALDKARPNGDGPGDHARAFAAFLTASQPKKTHGADIHVGVSVDQIAAGHVGRATRFPSLELGIEAGGQAGNCDSGYSCAYSSNLSWRTSTSPMAKEVNPRQFFERVFGNGVTGEAAENQARRDRYRKSILDFVDEDARRLKTRLAVADRRKLDEYLSSVREIEMRLARVETAHDRPPVKPTMPIPAGIPQDYQEHIRLMIDMLVLALQGDVTRVATLPLANDGSNRSYSFMGVPEGHHDLSHHGRDEKKQAKLQLINHFHIVQFEYLLTKMKAVKEGGGSMLDHSMVLYGSGISDGDAHNHDDLPILLAGRAGGTVKSGRHIKMSRETPLANLYVSMLQRIGAPVKSFGDSTGPLTVIDS